LQGYYRTGQRRSAQKERQQAFTEDTEILFKWKKQISVIWNQIPGRSCRLSPGNRPEGPRIRRPTAGATSKAADQDISRTSCMRVLTSGFLF